LLCAITALAFAFCALSVEKKNPFHLEENIIQGGERQRGEKEGESQRGL